MTGRFLGLCIAAGLVLLGGACADDSPRPDDFDLPRSTQSTTSAARPDARPPVVIEHPGTIEGHVRLDGTPPGNRVIRMAMDPRCAEITQGQMVIQAEVLADREGNLANVFAYLEGDLPSLPPSSEPVTIHQRGCIYEPRVAGVQIGQPFIVASRDDLVHNVHTSSRAGNEFNVGQPRAGSSDEFELTGSEVMMRIGCDIHRWMVAYVGVLDHPYFAVSSADGSFQIANIPPGTYTLHTWHEVYGEHTETVEVAPDPVTSVELAYTAEEP